MYLRNRRSAAKRNETATNGNGIAKTYCANLGILVKAGQPVAFPRFLRMRKSIH
jgi:hypothetical protein